MSYTTMSEALADLRDRREQSLSPGSDRSIAKQRARGKMTARERVDALLDPGSFMEVGQLRRAIKRTDDPNERRPFGDGVITGRGLIDGRPVCVFSQDYTVFGGSVGEVYAQNGRDHGSRRQDGVPDHRPGRLRRCAHPGGHPRPLQLRQGGRAQRAALRRGAADLGDHGHLRRRRRVLARDDRLHLHGERHLPHVRHRPEVVQEVTGQATTMEELGGATVNAEVGNCHLVEEDDAPPRCRPCATS